MTQDVCEFWLEIEHHMTMMDNKMAVYSSGGKLYHYNVLNTSTAQPVDPDHVIVADGWEKQRLVITVNNTMPGPSIEVYEGQTVIVHVKNLLTGSAISVHWHGLHQKGTPWSDGVSFVIQCPISPGQEFTYKFMAYPKGTNWYHAHTGSQLSMGLLGPFIVRERRPAQMEEFIMMLQDWNHDMDSDLTHNKMLNGHYEDRIRIQPTGSLEGGSFSMFAFQSGLINGKGRYYTNNTSYTESPLTVFTVSQNKLYRFRVIGAGNMYPFRVSVDEHSLQLVATDGNEIKPKGVESFIINPGERYDFVINTTNDVNNYWIRAETLEVNVTNHIALAILRYKNSTETYPQTTRRNCTMNHKCLVANCPFSYYPELEYTTCINLDEFVSAENVTVPGIETDKENIEEIFLNFAFPGITENPGSVNGRQFKLPTVAALTQMNEVKTFCQAGECGEDKICQCTYSISLQHNKVYQLIFTNMGQGKGWAHPIHLHGHSFHVLKMGYPKYNDKTGKFLQENLDVDCRGNPDRELSFCNSATWANHSWGGNNIPGLQLQSPPVKDTIIVPTGGYVIVRFKADNPGLWFIHCHIELHSTVGMALMFNEAEELHPKPPANLPKCGDFVYTNKVEDGEVDYKVLWLGFLLVLSLQ
ncbi:fatty-acyl coenzyme A oxidase [Bulinus truncatus]|nr:fatty-acyl coenzyme A oxidase [Bulinus truncatus]